MGVNVERRGSPCVTESGGDDRNGHAGVKHLSGHEVTEIVKSEMTEPGSATHPDGALRDEVWRPRPGASPVRTEDAAVFGGRLSPIGRYHQVMASQELETRAVERNTVRTTCFGGHQKW